MYANIEYKKIIRNRAEWKECGGRSVNILKVNGAAMQKALFIIFITTPIQDRMLRVWLRKQCPKMIDKGEKRWRLRRLGYFLYIFVTSEY